MAAAVSAEAAVAAEQHQAQRAETLHVHHRETLCPKHAAALVV